MMTTSPCSSANLADDLLYGDGISKFVPPIMHATSAYINVSSEISSTHQSQTLKHFLAQKYAAESTSDGDTESHSNNNHRLSNTNNSPATSFSNTISNFYPFSPLVSSSSNSHFDTRNILSDGVLESSIDSLQVESSTNNTTEPQRQQQVSSHSSNHSLFADGLTPIDNFIKPQNIETINLPPSTSTPSVTSSSTMTVRQTPTMNIDEHSPDNNLCRVEIVPSSLFDTVNSDITVDSTTTITISQQQQTSNPSMNNVDNSSGLPSLSFNNFPSPLNQSSSNGVLAYGLSPNFSNTLLQIDNSQSMLPSLVSPVIQIDNYFHNSNNLNEKKHEERVILDQHQLLPVSIQSYQNGNHCLISDNSLSDNLFHDIPNETYQETEILNLHENVISDLPVETRAKASLPVDYLYLHPTETGHGVFARKTIPKRTKFGPIEGVIVSLPENQYSANNIAYSSKNSLIIFISDNLILSQADENTSNWTRFVRPATNSSEQNLELISKEFSPLSEVKFYLYTTKNIMPGEELKAWYSNEYSQTLQIKPLEEPDQFNLLEENQSQIGTIKKDSSIQSNSSTNVSTTGHKIRNKIAKTQMIQTNSNNKLAVENVTHLDSSFNGNQLCADLFNTNIQLVPTESVILNDNSIVENGKMPPNDSPQIDDQTSGKKQKNADLSDDKPKFQCDKCQKVFPRHYSLRRHLIMHSGEKRYKCPICNMAFNHVYNRNRHIKMHKNQSKEINNNKIQENLSNQVETPKNIDPTIDSDSNQLVIDSPDQSKDQQQDNGKAFTSNSTEKSIDSSDSTNQSDSMKMSDVVSSSGLDKSAKSFNKNGMSAKLYRCPQCYKRFSTEERLEKHSIVHDESAKKLSCGVCDRKFLTNSALSCHVKYHQFSSEEPRKYDCTLCDKVFDTIQLRREHVSVHKNPDTGFFHCPKCPKTFEDFSMIRKHLKSFHSNEIFPCTQCPKVFPRQDKLRLHMLCHIDRWEFKCNSCEKQFKRKDKLKEHTQRMHAPDRDVRIAAKIAARMHKVRVPRPKKVATKPSQPNYDQYVYKCHQCLLGFKRRGMLVNHLAKRHPETPYDSVPELTMPIVKTSKDYYCQYCEKIYKSSSKRKAHIIKNHPGQSLPPSNRSKSMSSDFVNPSYSQTVGSITINPHFCDWCHKQYASKAKLMQHQRKKHPNELQNSFSKQRSSISSNGDNTSTSITTNICQLTTVIAGDKATFTTVPMTPESIKTEMNSDHQIIPVESIKMESFLSDDSPSYLDSFAISNQYPKDNSSFLDGTSEQVPEQQIHYPIDSSNPSFEDLMNINIGPDVVTNNLNSINNSTNSNSSFQCNNVIRILACTNPSTGTTTFASDLGEFSDIITISDFQNAGKSTILSTNHHHQNSSVAGMNESTGSNTDLLISGPIVEENNWNQVCEEMAMV